MAIGESQSGLGGPGLPRLPAEGIRYYLGRLACMGLRNRLKEIQSLLTGLDGGGGRRDLADLAAGLRGNAASGQCEARSGAAVLAPAIRNPGRRRTCGGNASGAEMGTGLAAAGCAGRGTSRQGGGRGGASGRSGVPRVRLPALRDGEDRAPAVGNLAEKSLPPLREAGDDAGAFSLPRVRLTRRAGLPVRIIGG